MTKPPKPNENGTGVSEIYPIPPLPPPYYRPHPYAGLLPPAGEQVGVGSYDALLRPPLRSGDGSYVGCLNLLVVRVDSSTRSRKLTHK